MAEIVNSLPAYAGVSARELLISAARPRTGVDGSGRHRVEFYEICGTRSNKCRGLFGLGFEPLPSALRAVVGEPARLTRAQDG
jgi:hypothetical protein